MTFTSDTSVADIAAKIPSSAAPLVPKHPDRVCWGCDKYCPADDLACGNGTIRTPHPIELFGPDWLEWSANRHGGDTVAGTAVQFTSDQGTS